MPNATAPDPTRPSPANTESAPESTRTAPETQSGSARDHEASLLDLLMEDLSWDVVKRVLQYEIPLPFSSRAADLADEEVGGSALSKEESEELAHNKNLVGDKIGEILVQRNEITRAQFQQAKKLRERTRQPIWRTLLQLKLVSPAQIARVYRMELPSGPLPDSKFTQWLIDNKRTTRAQLAQAWEAAKAERIQFHDHLRAERIVTDEDIAEALASQTKAPYDSLAGLKRPADDVIRRLPLNVPLRYHALPIRFNNGTLEVAFAKYEDVLEFYQFGLILDFKVQPVMVPSQKLNRLLEQFRKRFANELEPGDVSPRSTLTEEIELAPTENALDRVLAEVVRRDGSDIHFEPQRGFYRVRFRIDGLLHDMLSLNSVLGRRVVNQIKALAGMDLANNLVPQDGHLVSVIDEEHQNFRISTIPAREGEKVVLRLVRHHFAFSRLDQLGMTLEQRQLMDEILNIPAGLILAAGPVGSGKTTTLYSCLNCMNLFSRNVMTIEDPVEYELPGTTQSQVNPKAHFTFSVGLRSILRQDPDVIMVGEIRDDETAAIAVRAALAGEKVLSSLHASSAVQAYASLILAGIRPSLVAHALTGVVFQQLVRKVCPHCAQKHVADAKLKRELGVPAKRRLVCRIGKGCRDCLYTGLKGRTGVFEMLRVSNAFRNAVAETPGPREIETAARKSGLVPLRAHVVKLLSAGVIPPSEALEVL